MANENAGSAAVASAPTETNPVDQAAQQLAQQPEVQQEQQTQASEGVKVELHAADPTKAAFESLIPAEYKDKPWIQEALKAPNPTESFFKSYENAQKLIGSRPQGIIPPSANATPEQIKEYHKQLGVSENIGDYGLADVEWKEDFKQVGEFVTKSRDPRIVSQMQKVAQEAGLTPAQFKKVAAGFEIAQAVLGKNDLAAKAQAAEKDTMDFNVEFNNMFGSRAMEVMDNGRKLMEQNVPASVKAKLADPSIVPPAALAVFAAVLDGVQQRYIRPDSFGGTRTANAGSMPISQAQIQERGRQLMSDKAYQDPRHPGHEAAKRLVDDNYKLLNQIKK